MNRTRDWRHAAADFDRCLSASGRRRLGRFTIEGLRLHERALRAGVVPSMVLAAESWLASDRERDGALLAALREAGCEPLETPDAEIAARTEGRETGPLLGLVPLPDAPDRGALLARDPDALLLVVDEVEDPGNVGALVRTALAGGAAALVAAGISDPWHPRAVRTSMGSLFKLPLLRYPDAHAVMSELRQRGFTTVGAVSTRGEPLPAFRRPDGPLAVFVGREAFGLDADRRAALDHRVTIPMRDGVDSYSVNAAAAILLYALGPGRRSLD